MMDDGIVSHRRFELAGAKQYQPALVDLLERWELQNGIWGDDILLTASEVEPLRKWLFHLPDGTPVGHLTSRSKIGAELAAGKVLARAQVALVERGDSGLVLIGARIWTGPVGSTVSFRKRIDPDYFAQVVGEQYHAAAVGRCRPGEPAYLVHESGNPHDPQALAVYSCRQERIGYIPSNHWLRRAVMDDGQPCTAMIHSAGVGRRGFCQIVLSVQLSGSPVARVKYSESGADGPMAIPIILTVLIAIVVIGLSMLGTARQ